MAGDERQGGTRRRMAFLPTAAVPIGLANGVAAVASVGTIILLTRLLTAEGFGYYAMVMALAMIVHNAGYFAIQSTLIRFHARARDAEAERRLATGIRIAFLIASVAVTILWALAVSWLGAAGLTGGLAVAGLVLLLLRGWLSLVQAWNRAMGRYWTFFALEALQSFGGLVLAVVALRLVPAQPAGAVWAAAAAAALAAACAPCLLLIPPHMRGVGRLLRELAAYGAPLAVVFLAGAALAVSDRLIIAVYAGPAAAGAYAVAFAIADRLMNLLLLPVPVSTKPALFAAWEERGQSAARPLLDRSARWLIAIGFPTATLLIFAPEPIARSLAGGGLAQDTARMIPWLAAGSLLSCLLSLHFTLAFQLSRKTVGMIPVVGIPALLNLVANLILVPSYGMIAAGWTTVGGYALAVLLAIVLGRRAVAVPFPIRSATLGLIGSGVLAAVLRFAT